MTDPYLPDPKIEFPDGDTPVSGVSGDVYFSKAGGVDETRHVFLGGIGAPAVWDGRQHYRIGELGFGTGMNFLVTWRAWADSVPDGAQLEYLAVEGYPIPLAQLRRILGQVPELRSEADALLASWPARVGGVHRLSLDGGRVRLTLLFGEARLMLKQAIGTVDAWYLDGFSPSKNPGMWTPEVLGEIRRLSAPGARVATFSAAGHVRRTLAGLGFAVEKRPGFGYKRDCVAGRLPGETVDRSPKTVAVVGAGIAGCTIARALKNRNIDVTLIDKAASPGSGASGNPAALLAPRLPRERTPLGRIMAAGYLHAVRYYDGLAMEGDKIWLGARGGLALARNGDEAERQTRAVTAFGWPSDVMRQVDAAEASACCGADVETGGLWFASAGTLSPPAITAHLSRGIRYCQAETGGWTRRPLGWQLHDTFGVEIGEFDTVVVAAGVGVSALMAGREWPLRANRGQLAYLTGVESAPRVPVTYGGYLTPEIELPTGRSGHVLGATYARRDELPDEDWENPRSADEAQMLAMLGAHLPSIAVLKPDGGRVALRATIRDYIPLAGRVEEGLYVIGGLGSRGFLTAPLLSELIADQITGAPLPLEAELASALDPLRFD